MSVMINKAEGVTVFTIKSNPKNKWPPICQILGTLCCSPFCAVSRGLKQQLGSAFRVLGTLQIVVGLMNLGIAGITTSSGRYILSNAYWLGGLFIFFGIICILVEKFPSMCTISFTVLVNLVSAALAITAIVFYSIDMADLWYSYSCSPPNSYSYYYYTTPSPVKKAQMNEMVEICNQYKHILVMTLGGLDILMIVLGVLQLCVTISSCVLSLKTLCKKKGDKQEDPELYKPLMEEVLSSPAC